MAPPVPDPRPDFVRDLLRAGHRLRLGRLHVRIPPLRSLHRRRPRSHFHATPELFLQTGGATRFECPEQTFRLASGDICVMPRGVPHAETPLDLRRPYGVIVCMQSRDGFFIHRARADEARRILGYNAVHVTSPRARDMFHYLDTIAESDPGPAPHRPAVARALLEAFLLTAVTELQRAATAHPPLGSPLVLEAEKWVRTHLADPKLTVAAMARAQGCSPDHLTRRFRCERGLSPIAWITRERITLARDLLAEGRYRVAEVGWACGFNEPSYFIRVFRRHTGTTPRAYRLGLTPA